MMRWVWPGTALMRTSRKPIVPERLIFTSDKLRSKKLPEEFVAFANDQLAAKINQAHQVILKPVD